MSDLNGFIFTDQAHVITVTGADVADFLQRLTTVNIKKFVASDDGSFGLLRGAFTRANGSSLSLFEIAKENATTFHLLVDSALALKTLLSHIEDMHFGEDLKYSDSSSDFFSSYVAIETVGGAVPFTTSYNNSVWYLQNYLQTPMRWTLIFGKAKNADELNSKIAEAVRLQPISNPDFHAFQILGGRPRWFNDLREDQLVLEFPLDDYVHRNKGCYPGQEVLERLYTYGNAAKFALVLTRVGLEAQTPLPNANPALSTQDPVELPAASLVGTFEFSESIPNKIQPRSFILAVILRVQVKPDATYVFAEESLKSIKWTPERTYLSHLVATRSEAKSN